MTRGFRAAAEGAVAIEAAIVMPMLLLMVVGVIGFTLFLFAWDSVDQAAQGAGRYAMLIGANAADASSPGNCQASFKTKVASNTYDTVFPVTVSVTSCSTGSPGSVTITASYSAPLLIYQLFTGRNFTLSNTVTVPLI